MNEIIQVPSIFLVENDSISIEVTRLFLKDFCEFDFALNGDEAIAKIWESISLRKEKKSKKPNKYDVILMDINLGLSKNGLQVVREIRKIEGYEKTPIVALTAYAMPGDKEEFLSSGCTYYLSKPFSKNELINLLKLALNLK
ncbi:MAG: hypothetical protein STSR0008_07140 [Ignavibacterium sp.]